MKRILHVAGARPNFMKIAPIIEEMYKFSDFFEQTLVHTGQHYDDNMSKIFFKDLDLPQPDIYLGIGSGTHAQQTARIMLKFEPVLLEYKPDWVIVVGDVNSTLTSALTAAKLGIRVAHVEAGLRSFDRTMPEEINRVLTDHIADLLFTTEPSANENLLREGVPEGKIHFVGNVMIDTLIKLLPKIEGRAILWEMGLVENKSYEGVREESKLKIRDYILVTLHRPSNVDCPEVLQEIMLALYNLAHDVPIIFPVHPRTKQQIERNDLRLETRNLILLQPLGYLDFLALMRHAAVVITDSGGIQEETTYLGIPCLTIRPNTERPITIEIGTNQLVPGVQGRITESVRTFLGSFRCSSLAGGCPKLWDGKAAKRIVDVMKFA